jgi:hypothetical protein
VDTTTGERVAEAARQFAVLLQPKEVRLFALQ